MKIVFEEQRQEELTRRMEQREGWSASVENSRKGNGDRLEVYTAEEVELQLGKLPEEVIRQMRDRQACGLKEANGTLPLAEGEVIGRDEFTALKTPFGGCPAYTPVLKRTTDRGTVYFLFDDTQWDGNAVADRERPLEVRSVAAVVRGIGISPVSLLQSFLEGFFSKAGEELFAQLVPVTDQVNYNRIADVVEAALQEQVLKDMQGVIKGIQLTIETSYTAYTSDEKVKFLQKGIEQMNEVLSRLLQDDVKLQGLPLYMDAVLMTFTLYKAWYDLTENETVKEAVQVLARQSVTSAEANYELVKNCRKAKVYKKRELVAKPGATMSGCIGAYFVYWKDNLTGEKESFECQGGKNDPAPGQRDASYEQHIKDILNTLETELRTGEYLATFERVKNGEGFGEQPEAEKK